MGIVSGGGGGSFNGGTITQPLVSRRAGSVGIGLTIHGDPDATYDSLIVTNDADLPAVNVNAVGELVVTANSPTIIPVSVVAHAAQSSDLVTFERSDGVGESGVNKNRYIWTKKTSAPADAELVGGQLMLWFDQTNGASKLMVKAKQADGTVRTAAIALA